MNRAVLLPHPADPFLLHYFLTVSYPKWKDEISTLYIYINSPIEHEVVEYMLDVCHRYKNIEVFYIDRQMEHGTVIRMLLDRVQEQYVMLIEDDGIIFRSGIVDKYFSMLESGTYDVIGSPRGSCHDEIWNAAQKKWDLDYTAYGDVGPNFWPCFFFTKKEILMKTDRNFGAKSWSRGELIKSLDHIVEAAVCPSDTFVNTSLQIRSMIEKSRILEIPQYHGSPSDWQDYEDHKNIFDGKSSWFHIGSLSSGTHGQLVDDFGRVLARRKTDSPIPDFRLHDGTRNLQEQMEWERRVQWWMTFWENREADKIVDFADEYKKAINRITKYYNLDYMRIVKRQRIYETLGV